MKFGYDNEEKVTVVAAGISELKKLVAWYLEKNNQLPQGDWRLDIISSEYEDQVVTLRMENGSGKKN